MVKELSEEALYFRNEKGQKLFGVLHHCAESSRPAVVFCHPFAEEKQKSYRPLVAFSRYLARKNIGSLRFDCVGSGDSEGASDSWTVASQVSDTSAAIRVAKERLGTEEIWLVGLRFGAAIALFSAQHNPSVNGVALLFPIIDGSNYWGELLKAQQYSSLSIGLPAKKKLDLLAQLQQSGQIELDAQIFSVDLIDQLSSINLLESASQYPGRVLIVAPLNDDAVNSNVRSLAKSFSLSSESCEIWSEEIRDFWTSQSMYNAYLPKLTFSKVASWIQE